MSLSMRLVFLSMFLVLGGCGTDRGDRRATESNHDPRPTPTEIPGEVKEIAGSPSGGGLDRQQEERIGDIGSVFADVSDVRAGTFYEVEPNKSAFPLPYELPKLGGAPRSEFDWDAYYAAAKSEADLAFRRHVSRYGAGWPTEKVVISKGGERILCPLAAAEFKAKCDALIERYRSTAAKKPEVLERLNRYFGEYESALDLQVRITGDRKGRMFAYLNYWRNLQALGMSFDLQR